MKKRICFASVVSSDKPQTVSYREVEGGVEFDFVFFSTAFNRNRAFFQVVRLLQAQNTLEKILFNFNHDLNESGGKYLGNKTKVTKLWYKIVDGELEIRGTVFSSDSLVVARKDEITGPSIEIQFDMEDLIQGENGFYIINFEWVGCAFLTGVMAGSGNARTLDVREFNQQLSQDMTKEQLIEFFKSDEGKTELTAVFNEVVASTRSNSTDVEQWRNSEGELYEAVTKRVWEQVVTKIDETLNAGFTQLTEKLEAKFAETPGNQDGETPAQKAERERTEAEFARAEAQRQAKAKAAQFNKLETEGQQTKAPNVSGFLAKFKK